MVDSPSALGLDIASPTTIVACRPVSHQPIMKRLKPRLSTLTVSAALYAVLRHRRLPLPRFIKVLVFLLGVTNWRAFPFYWSLWIYVPVYKVWCDSFLKKFPPKSQPTPPLHLGTHHPSNGTLTVESKQLTKPTQATSLTCHIASLNACDFFLHLSNSSYAYALDRARLEWFVKYIGTMLRQDREGVQSMLASTHFTFFQEIPMLAEYEVVVRPVSWDQKWLYLCSVFTTAPPRGSKQRVVNCISISRTVFKIGRVTIRPERVFALAGFGERDLAVGQPRSMNGLTTSSRTSRDRRSVEGNKSWLLSKDDVGCGFEKFEQERLDNLEVVRSCLDGSAGAEHLKRLV